MGASIYLRFPGGESGDHPGLPGDDSAYARWIEAILADEALSERLRSVGCGALLFTFPAFEPDKKMQWTSPAQLRGAAAKLKTEVLAQSELGRVVAERYKVKHGDEPPHELLAEDLDGIAGIAAYAQEEALDQVAITIGW